MSSATLLLKTYLKFYITTRRFLVIVPVYLLLSLLFPALYLVGVLAKPADVYLYTAGLVGSLFAYGWVALVAGLLAGDALSQDFSRQGLVTLTQPIRRSVIMLARYGSAVLASIVVILVASMIPIFIFSEVFYQSLVPSALGIVGLGVVFITAIVAFVLLFSSLFKSPAISIVLSLAVVWLLMPAISSFLPFVGIEPWFLITYAGGSIGGLAEQAYPPHLQQITSGGFGNPSGTTFNPTVPEALAIMLGYLIVSLALAWFVYSRREMKDIS